MRPVAKRFRVRPATAAQSNSPRFWNEPVSIGVQQHDLIRLLDGDRVGAVALQVDRNRHWEWLEDLPGLRYGYWCVISTRPIILSFGLDSFQLIV